VKHSSVPEILISPAYNPCPSGATAGYVKAVDGAQLRYARWRAGRAGSKGTVIILNGRAEYIEKYYETIADIQARGFEVLSFDWRGQGGSSRMLENPRAGYVDDFDQYIGDLHAIMDQVALPDCKGPYYILGHSTGSLVALLAAPSLSNRVRRMVLCAPLVGLGRQPIPIWLVKPLAAFLTALGLGEVYLTGSSTPGEIRAFKGNPYTKDRERFERNRQMVDDHRKISLGGATAAWVYASCNAMRRVADPDFYPQINIPTLMITASSDSVVNNRAVERLGKRLKSGSSLSVNGARHELLQERDIARNQVLAAFDAFVPGSGDIY